MVYDYTDGLIDIYNHMNNRSMIIYIFNMVYYLDINLFHFENIRAVRLLRIRLRRRRNTLNYLKKLNKENLKWIWKREISGRI